MMALTDEQKRIRKLGIGSSEIAAVAGLDESRSAFDVWTTKVDGPKVETIEPELASRGRHLEDGVANWFAEDHDVQLTNPGTMVLAGTIALATPDRLVQKYAKDPDSCLEIKTVGFRSTGWGEPGTDQVPPKFLCQGSWEAFVARGTFPSIKGTHVSKLGGGLSRADYYVEFSQALAEKLLEAAERFWRDFVVTGKPPPITGSKTATEWLKAKYPLPALSSYVKANGEQELALERLAALEAQQASLEAEATAIKNATKLAIGDRTGMESTGYVANWKAPKGSVNWKNVAEELMGVLTLAEREAIRKKHTPEIGSRRFTLSTKEE